MHDSWSYTGRDTEGPGRERESCGKHLPKLPGTGDYTVRATPVASSFFLSRNGRNKSPVSEKDPLSPGSK